MQDTPALINYPENILSILMASTQRIDLYATASGFNDEAGTGMLNLNNALQAVDNRCAFTVSKDKEDEYVSTKKVYLKKGQTIRIAFVSLVNNKASQTSNLVTDYDLYLTNSDGTTVAKSITYYNSEFVEYKVTTTGYYTIKILQFAKKKTSMKDFCSYTYFIQ